MIQKISKIIFLVFTCLFLVVLQAYLINSLPGSFRHLNLGLLAAIFSLFLFGFKASLRFVLIFGFLFDALSFYFFGLQTIALFLSILAAYLVLKDWLTNKSLYAFWASTLLATAVYNFLLALLTYAALGFPRWAGVLGIDFWHNLLYQSVWSLGLGSVFFYLSIALFKKLKPFFLENRKMI